MARTRTRGIRGRGEEVPDTVLAALMGGLTAVSDGWLLVHLRRDARTGWVERELPQATLALIGFTALTALLGATLAGRRSTPHRRWRWAMLSALLGHLLALGALIGYLLFHPRGFVVFLLP
ncbi:hypothetical protein [Kitasatospora sp. NPDC057738]|uniref:hypothetical protein n=1 Tax=Kitasatospora sp. NPDC057738 TaxID=3346233 RepID=UPI0036B2B85E